MRILVAEDDQLLGEGIQAGLGMAGYVVDWARDGQEAMLALRNEKYAAWPADISMPKMDGLTVLSKLRSAEIYSCARITDGTRYTAGQIKGLDTGADDYLIKPFDLNELQARIRTLLRRAAGSASSIFSYAGVQRSKRSSPRRVALDGVYQYSSQSLCCSMT